MPHKFTREDLLADYKNSIARCDSEIARVKSTGGNNAEGRKAMIEYITDLQKISKNTKEDALYGTLADGKGILLEARAQERAVLVAHGQEAAFQTVLDLISDPEKSCDHYVAERAKLAAELKKLEIFEQRPTAS